MRWHTWIAAPLIAAMAGLFAAGSLASLLVEWYRMPSFEGQSGFFVVGIALAGFAGGLVIGVIAAIVVARRPRPGFVKAAGSGAAAVVAIVLVIGVASRLQADIPPEIGGEALNLQVEVRWPSGSPEPSSLGEGGYVRLARLSGSTVGRSEDGPLWLEDARQEDGQWIVPGAVEIFTSRGQRILDVGIGDQRLAGFLVPLPGSPGAQHEAWSEWLPRAGTSGQGGLTYRFRAVRTSQPIRVLHSGPFELLVVASRFYRTAAHHVAAHSTVKVRHGGAAVPGAGEAEYVATVTAPDPTLFLTTRGGNGTLACRFVVASADGARVEDVGMCPPIDRIYPLTSDPVRFAAARDRPPADGWPDRATFDVPGLYLVGDVVIDTRIRGTRRFTKPAGPYPVSNVPPLGLSPDERSIVWFAADSDSRPWLAVTDVVADTSYALPIHRRRMRYSATDLLDPEWVSHHFEWTRDANGTDRLAERKSFEPLPHRGTFEENPPSYTIGPGAHALRDAVARILVSDLGAQKLPDGEYGFARRVRFEGAEITITTIESGPYVYVAYEGGSGDSARMRRIADAVDRAMATTKWDAAFEDK